jgi:hypothetical protein
LSAFDLENAFFFQLRQGSNNRLVNCSRQVGDFFPSEVEIQFQPALGISLSVATYQTPNHRGDTSPNGQLIQGASQLGIKGLRSDCASLVLLTQHLLDQRRSVRHKGRKFTPGGQTQQNFANSLDARSENS